MPLLLLLRCPAQNNLDHAEASLEVVEAGIAIAHVVEEIGHVLVESDQESRLEVMVVIGARVYVGAAANRLVVMAASHRVLEKHVVLGESLE